MQVSPPHTSYLPDYTDPFSNQLKLFLTLTDFSVPSYQVKLRLSFEGNGYSITTASLLNLPATTLSPGVPVEISGSDLAPYLNSQNLLFSGIDVADYEQRKILPEGPCKICVEVVDFSNPNQSILSNPACTQVWFSLNDPPLLNTPFCGNQLAPLDPQAVIFSWTPLHMNSLHSVGTQYVFELFEIRPNDADPNQVVHSSLPIFMQVTDQTYLNYGITEPQLQVGMSYAWRVRAQDIQGRDFFRNSGYSAVCTFTYGSIASSLADGIELTLNSNGTGTRMGLAWWNVSSTFTNYKIEVRKTGNPSYEWFPFESQNGELKIYQLEPSTQYECRVKGIIGTEYESAWSNTSVFTTQPTPDYACGNTTLPPRQQQFTPLKNAIPGMVFAVGQFEMHVTDIEPVNATHLPGHYRGTGKIAVGFTLVNIRVKFDDILVDDNLAVRLGKVEAITQGMDAWLADQTQAKPDYYVDGTITDFEWNDSTSLTVWVDGVPQEFEFPKNGILVIQDEEGMVYTFKDDGTWSVTSILLYSEDVLAASANYRVDFSAAADQEFGFDEKKYAAWINDYEVIRLGDSSNYFVPYKSLAPNQTDVVTAGVRSQNPLTGLTFEAIVNGQSTNLTATEIDDSTYVITLAGLSESCFVYAVQNGNRIGKLRVKVLPEIEKKVVIVPVNGATLSNQSDLENQLNEIYAQANVSFTLTQASNYSSIAWDLNADGRLQQGDVSLMSHYSEEMRLLRDQYFELNPDTAQNAYYLFIIPTFEAEDLSGYMVRGKAIGFLKSGENAKTAAHELAHGIFALEHTFPEIAIGTTNNLMDYGAGNSSHLSQQQWYLMHEPLPAFSMFDNEEEGELTEMMSFDLNEINFSGDVSSATSYSCNQYLTQWGKIITFTASANAVPVMQNGILTGIQLSGYAGKQDGFYTAAVRVITAPTTTGSLTVASKTLQTFFVNLEDVNQSNCPVYSVDPGVKIFRRIIVQEGSKTDTIYRNVPDSRFLKFVDQVDCAPGLMVVSGIANGTANCRTLTGLDCEDYGNDYVAGDVSPNDPVELVDVYSYYDWCAPAFSWLSYNGKPVQATMFTDIIATEHLISFNYEGTVYRQYVAVKSTGKRIPLGYVDYAALQNLQPSEGTLKVKDITAGVKFNPDNFTPALVGEQVHYRVYDQLYGCFEEFMFVHTGQEKYIIDYKEVKDIETEIYFRESCGIDVLVGALCDALTIAGEGISDAMGNIQNLTTIPEYYYNPEKPEYESWVYNTYSYLNPDLWLASDNLAQTKFAYLCGLYNGLINEVTEIIKIIPLFFEYACKPEVRTAINDAFAQLSWETVKDDIGEDFAGNDFLKAEAAGRYTVAILSVVIPISKVSWVSKMKTLITSIKSLPKKTAKFINKVKTGTIQMVQFTKGEIQKLVLTAALNIEIARFLPDNTFRITPNHWFDQEYLLEDVVEEIGELTYKVGDEGATFTDELVLVEKSDGGVGIGRNLPSVIRVLNAHPSYKPYRVISSNPNKTTTFIGKWDELVNGNQNGLQIVIENLSQNDLNIYMLTGKLDHPGGFNMLSIEDWNTKVVQQAAVSGVLPNTKAFDDFVWDTYNKPWLESAMQRGDEIIIWSDPTLPVNIEKYFPEEGVFGKSFYGRELDFIQSKSIQYGYNYDHGILTGTFSIL